MRGLGRVALDQVQRRRAVRLRCPGTSTSPGRTAGPTPGVEPGPRPDQSGHRPACQPAGDAKDVAQPWQPALQCDEPAEVPVHCNTGSTTPARPRSATCRRRRHGRAPRGLVRCATSVGDVRHAGLFPVAGVDRPVHRRQAVPRPRCRGRGATSRRWAPGKAAAHAHGVGDAVLRLTDLGPIRAGSRAANGCGWCIEWLPTVWPAATIRAASRGCSAVRRR